MYIVGIEVVVPTILRIRNLRFYFYSGEHEPPHVHVSIGKSREFPHVKVVLTTLDVTSVRGFSRSDVAKIVNIVEAYREHLLDAWEDYFDEEE